MLPRSILPFVSTHKLRNASPFNFIHDTHKLKLKNYVTHQPPGSCRGRSGLKLETVIEETKESKARIWVEYHSSLPRINKTYTTTKFIQTTQKHKTILQNIKRSFSVVTTTTYSHSLYEPYRLYELAKEKFNEGKQDDALETIYSAIEKFPDQTYLYCFGGLLIDATDNYVLRARNILEKARITYPDDLTIKLNLAICLTISRWTEDAIDLFIEVLEVEPDNVEALHYLSTAYLYAEEFELAKEAIYRKLEIKYEASGLANLFAIFLAEYQITKDMDDCLTTLKLLLEMNPSYREYVLKEAKGYGEEALKRITEVVHSVLGYHYIENNNDKPPLLGSFHE